MGEALLGHAFVWKLGGGVIAGMAVGYAVKRTTRLLLFALGVGVLILYALTRAGYVAVDWNAMSHGLADGTRSMAGWLWHACKQLSVTMVGFAGGLLAGLKMR